MNTKPKIKLIEQGQEASPSPEPKAVGKIKILSVEDNNNIVRPVPNNTNNERRPPNVPAKYVAEVNVIKDFAPEKKPMQVISNDSDNSEDENRNGDTSQMKIIKASKNKIRRSFKKHVDQLEALKRNLYQAKNNGTKFTVLYKELKQAIPQIRNERRSFVQFHKFQGESLIDFIAKRNAKIDNLEAEIRQWKKELSARGILNVEQENMLQSVMFSDPKAQLRIQAESLLKKQNTNEQKKKSNELNLALSYEEVLSFKKNLCSIPNCGDRENPKTFKVPECPNYHQVWDKIRHPYCHNNKSLGFYSPKGVCIKCFTSEQLNTTHGIKCFYTQNVFEFYYHPVNFKNHACTLSSACSKKYCPYFHSQSEKQQWENLLSQNGILRKAFKCRPPTSNNKIFNPITSVEWVANKSERNMNNDNDKLINRVDNNMNQINHQYSFNHESKPQFSNPPIYAHHQNNYQNNNFREERKIEPQNIMHNDNHIYSKPMINEFQAERLKPSPHVNSFYPEPKSDALMQQKASNLPSIPKQAAGKKGRTKGIDYYIKGELATEDGYVDDKRVEYKNFRGPEYINVDYQKIFKTICGFINASGGTLYIGVDDITHGIVATYMENKHYDEFKLKVVMTIKGLFSPSIADEYFSIKRIPVLTSEEQEINKKTHTLFVIKIEVKPDDERIYYVKKVVDSEPIYTAYIRDGGVTKIISGEELNQLFKKRQSKI
jgi:peptidyl-tRNA hydrolase